MHLHFLFINQEGSHNFEEVFWGIKKNKKIKTSKREKTLPLRSYAVGRRTERTSSVCALQPNSGVGGEGMT